LDRNRFDFIVWAFVAMSLSSFANWRKQVSQLCAFYSPFSGVLKMGIFASVKDTSRGQAVRAYPRVVVPDYAGLVSAEAPQAANTPLNRGRRYLIVDNRSVLIDLATVKRKSVAGPRSCGEKTQRVVVGMVTLLFRRLQEWQFARESLYCVSGSILALKPDDSKKLTHRNCFVGSPA